MPDKLELVLVAMQQRMGEMVAGYEAQIAMLRADITLLLDEKVEREKSIQEYNEHLNNITN